MKILFLNGSPRRNGMGAQYLKSMAQMAEEHGNEVTFYNISQMNIRPCLGCEVCREKRSCVLPEDDSVRFLEDLQRADVFVVGSPCYIYNVSGQLKMLFDRIVYGLMKEGKLGLPQPLLKGKRALLVITSTAPWPFNHLLGYTTGTYRALKRILDLGGIRIKGCVMRGNTKKVPAFTQKDIKKSHRLMHRVF